MNEITYITHKYAEAVLQKDSEAFLSLYSIDVVVFDTWMEWAYVGREAFSETVRKWFGSLGSDRVEVSFTEVKTIVSKNNAHWYGFVRYAGVGSDGVELRSMQNRLSWVLRRAEGEWQIAHEHTSVPIDNETLKGRLTR